MSDGQGSKLDEVVNRLRVQMQNYPTSAKHYVADNALFGLAIDVIEHSIAVQLLRFSEVPRAAFANARAAFEAGLDALYLTSEPLRYDHFGCLARVHELHEDVRQQQRFNGANQELGLDLLDEGDLQRSVQEDSDSWEQVTPGRGVLLRTALAEFLARPGRERKHWTGLTREQICHEVARQINAESGGGKMYSAMYGTLSSQAHPRMRVGQRLAEEGETGFLFSARPSDKTVPAGAAEIACVSALAALERRRQFSQAAA